MIEADEVHVVLVEVPDTANVSSYDTFYIQFVPPTGATVTIKRTLPGTLQNVMDLQ